MTPKSKTAAIKYARENVTDLSPIGNQYSYMSFDEGLNAWRESTPTDYHSARNFRSETLIQYAREALGFKDTHIHFDGGNWTDYILSK